MGEGRGLYLAHYPGGRGGNLTAFTAHNNRSFVKGQFPLVMCIYAFSANTPQATATGD